MGNIQAGYVGGITIGAVAAGVLAPQMPQ